MLANDNYSFFPSCVSIAAMDDFSSSITEGETYC